MGFSAGPVSYLPKFVTQKRTFLVLVVDLNLAEVMGAVLSGLNEEAKSLVDRQSYKLAASCEDHIKVGRSVAQADTMIQSPHHQHNTKSGHRARPRLKQFAKVIWALLFCVVYKGAHNSLNFSKSVGVEEIFQRVWNSTYTSTVVSVNRLN